MMVLMLISFTLYYGLILKLLAWLLPVLYSTQSNNCYLSQQKEKEIEVLFPNVHQKWETLVQVVVNTKDI